MMQLLPGCADSAIVTLCVRLRMCACHSKQDTPWGGSVHMPILLTRCSPDCCKVRLRAAAANAGGSMQWDCDVCDIGLQAFSRLACICTQPQPGGMCVYIFVTVLPQSPAVLRIGVVP